MNLEQIDTSTTAGKAEVMRLAAEGRKVAQRTFPGEAWIAQRSPALAWPTVDYAIIAEPVGPDEVWVTVSEGAPIDVYQTDLVAQRAATPNWRVARYIRADLAGEVK